MTDQQVFELLKKVDSGYVPTREEIDVLSNIRTIIWNDISIKELPESIGYLTGLKEFNLRDTQIKELPKNIEKLSSLKRLYLSSTSINALPESIGKLTSLQSIELNDTRIKELPENIGKLTSLQNLELNDTEIKALPESIGDLVNLQSLYMSGANLRVLPESVGNLKSLQSLELSGANLSALPDNVGKLTSLQELDLSNTRIDKLPESIGKLTSLQSLNMSYTRISELPKNIGDLTSLRSLDLKSTNVRALPESIGNLMSLQELYLSNTQISELPDSIGGLTNLQSLDLSNTQLSVLPETLSNLLELQYLVLEDLTLIELPECLLKLDLEYRNNDYRYDDKQGIFINGLKLQNQPVEIFRQSRELIIEYYNSTKDKSTLPVNECKVVFLGDGGAGKSLIIDRLMHDGVISPEFDGESTPGISISSKKYHIGNEEIELHFWDFGGQAIMHSMHRLFLTNRTLYVVVANARDNKASEQAWYWIRNIKSFANKAPILLLVNQKDQNPSANVNVNGMRKEYAELKDMRIVSALKDSKEEFNRDIRDVLCQIVFDMETVHTPFSRSWLSLMNNLQEMKEDYITSDDFYTKCSQNHVDINNEILDRIINWYQDLGVCFYSKAHPVSARYMVLKPRWLLNALYILAFNGRKYASNGIIHEKDLFALICEDAQRDDVKKVWSDITYKPNEMQFIIYVLLNYELIYRLDYEHIFIPMLCDDNEPKEMDFINSDGTSHVIFEYMYLPENVLHLLMVRHGYDLNTETVWRTGAIFERRQCGWSSLVRIKDNCLDIYAKSDNQRIHPINSYLDIIRESISKVNEKLGLTAIEYITYREDELEDRFEHEILEGSKEAGQLTVYSKVFKRLLNVDEVLGIVKTPDKLSGSVFNDQINALLSSLMGALNKLQNNRVYYGATENMCNSYIRDLLEASGYICKDQTLRGTSLTGKSDGELDILIRDKEQSNDLSIYEALKLSAFGSSAKEYVIRHLVKLLNNNPTGIPNLFLVAYVSWERDRFDALAKDYSRFIMRDAGIGFKFKFILPMDSYSGSFSRCYKVGYDSGGILTNVFYVIVRVAE